ncbi:hypothetical protein CK203_042911 [Vitis vinifera]|uniref:Uncharacterized protein n=1 Tax=Vitis vinifera TaxID=29760 RepID=A0A438HUH2_VITVI|nr:hypothetical protein CK203_042911 [Vitis vinifera]
MKNQALELHSPLPKSFKVCKEKSKEKQKEAKRKTEDSSCSLLWHFWSTSRSPFSTCYISFQSSGSQESNASNRVRFGAEMMKIWPSEDNCIKLRDNFARWKSSQTASEGFSSKDERLKPFKFLKVWMLCDGLDAIPWKFLAPGRSRAPRPVYDQMYMPQTLALPYYASQALRDPRFPTRPQDSHAMLLILAVRHAIEPGFSEAYRSRVVNCSRSQAATLADSTSVQDGSALCIPLGAWTRDRSMHRFEACRPGFDRLGFDPELIMPDVIYEMSGVTLGSKMPAPFRLVPEAGVNVEEVQAPCVDDPQTLDVRYILRGGRVMRQPPPAAARLVEDTSAPEESLLASSSTHRDVLIRALSQIRVKTTTSPEGLIHMMPVGQATCIVFSDDDLPQEGSDHTRSLYISVGCSGRRVPFVLLDNGSALNVCPLATAMPSDTPLLTSVPPLRPFARMIALGGRSWVLRIPTSFNLLLGRPWIHRAEAIPSSLHQNVKFIHDGWVIVVQFVGDMLISAEPVLEISHADDDIFLTRFTFDEVQTLKMEDFCRDFVVMSFDQHSSTVVLDIMRSMSYLPDMGLGRRQHGPSEFMAFLDRDVPFGLGFIPTEAAYRHMARLHRERVRARLTHTPFYYPVRPYTMSLADYFVRASESRAPSDGIIGGLSTTQEIDEHGTFLEIGDIVDRVVPRDEYVDEMFAMSLSQTEEIALPELASPFDLFGVSVLQIAEEIQVAPALEVVEDVIVAVGLFDGLVGLVEGASDFVDPPLSFDVLSRFVSRHDYVSDFSSMDLSTFEYLPVSHVIDLSAPSSPTSQIFDIDDEIAQHDSNDDSSSASDSGPVDERISPAVGDTKIVDFGTADQPRELRIG